MRWKITLLISAVAFLIVGCAPLPPKTFQRTFDQPGIWKTIEVREDVSKDALWRMLVDSISQKFDLEVVQKDSGYIRTSWKYTHIVRKQVSSRYRSRIVVKLIGEDWGKLQIKCESNWLAAQGWVLGYDTRLLEDVYGDIQGRVGRVRR